MQELYIRGLKNDLVKCLPCKWEDLSLISRTHITKPGTLAPAYGACSGEAETGGSLGLTHRYPHIQRITYH